MIKKIRSQYEQTPDGLFKCPKCSKVMRAPQAVGQHLRSIHGIEGTSPSSIAGKKARLLRNEPTPKLGRPPIKDKITNENRRMIGLPAKRPYIRKQVVQSTEQVLGQINYCPCCSFPIRGLLALQNIQNGVK